MAKSTKKVPALKLTLGGAPSTPHTLIGLPGFYFINDFTPVGGEGELSLEDAKAHDADPGCHVQLVEIAPATAAKARKRQAALINPALRAARELARETDAEVEVERARDEIAAATGQTPDDPAGDGQEG